LDKEMASVENSVNLFLNNPLFETWIIPSLIASDGVLKEAFRNYFPEDFYLGFLIYSSKMIDVFSLGVPRSESIKYVLNSQNKIKFYNGYLLKVRKLTKDMDFIDGFFVLVIDKDKFFNYLLGDDKNSFELIYAVQGNEVVYSSREVPKDYLKLNISADSISIWGNTFRQSVIPYEDINVGFVIPKPSWVRWLYIFVKILLLAGFFVGFFYINSAIKRKLRYAEDMKQKIIKDLKKSFSGTSLPASDVSISNMLVKATEKNLKFFEAFVEQDVKSLKETKKLSIFR
ncbi:MAG: hypothetical protein ABDH28_03655, partial [Brevinematia bacterium]